MLYIAICDDDQLMCTQIEIILENLNKLITEKIDIDIFYSGEALCRELIKKYYDVIFLDIELQSINGVEVGRKIREEMYNENTQIVYISGKDSYAMELFDTRPLNFLIKPLQEKKIEKIMMKIIELKTKKNQFFEYKFGNSQTKVFLKDILYFESDRKKIRIVLHEDIHEFYGKLSDIPQKLEGNDFISIHKSYLVNYNHVIVYQYEHVKMSNNTILPISQHNRKIVREKLLERRRRVNINGF